MKTNYFLIALLFNFLFQFAQAQNTFDIDFSNASRSQACQRCTQIFQQTPKEIRFSIERDKNNTLYFEVNDKQWFNQLFKNAGDGIAIDVVSKDRYGCLEVLLDVGQIRGELLKPVYATALKKTLKPYKNGTFRTRIGKLPLVYANKDVEFNMLFLGNKSLCRYQTIFNLEAYQLDLLDMGMYLDSITYKTKVSAKANEDQYTLKYKTLNFTIPFEKNKSTYSQEDIKPLYDSLRLTDFNIKSIDIKAYASIEGNLQRNMELQEQRANSIVTALQAFQKPTITTEVSSAENWVEFLNDIAGTSYENLKELNKQQIKAKVVGATAQALEPYLKNHRKAIISLSLEKKDRYNDQSIDQLIRLFNSAINEDELDTATELQNSIFEKLKKKEADPSVLNKMAMPKQLKYVPFFNKNSAMRYMIDIRNMLIAYNELQELERLAPKDQKVKYNLAALAIQLWRYKALPLKDDVIKKQIGALKDYGIATTLIKRMFVNYHIVRTENLMRTRDFANKDKSVDYIFTNYKGIPLRDYDYLSLAQYLTYYANIEQAITVLQDKVKQIDVNENLLFYYLNLTLVDDELTQQSDYRTIMLNAIDKDKKRYCRLFNPNNDGGVTFQLLENDYLRDTYCENCEQ